jgi:hypothetical protein
MGKIVKFEKCWSEEWTNKYGKADISHLLVKEITKESIVIQMKFVEEEEYRELFYEWKKSIRDKKTKKFRFNNEIDKIRKPIGMNILKYPMVKKKFEEWMRRERLIKNIG